MKEFNIFSFYAKLIGKRKKPQKANNKILNLTNKANFQGLNHEKCIREDNKLHLYILV